MNFEADDLLREVDQWKGRLHDSLGAMTPDQRTRFWKNTVRDARLAGLPVAKSDVPRNDPIAHRARTGD